MDDGINGDACGDWSLGARDSKNPEFEYDHVNHVRKSAARGRSVVGEGNTAKRTQNVPNDVVLVCRNLVEIVQFLIPPTGSCHGHTFHYLFIFHL